jgi:Ras-related protein Rab-6A
MTTPFLSASSASASSNEPLAIGILGDGGVGKTAFANALRGIPFEPRYRETGGHHVHTVTIGDKIINLCDTAGQDKYSELRYNYVGSLDAAILMFDLMSLTSFKSIAKHWLPFVRERFGDIPVIVVGNKSDCKDRTVAPGDYIEVSSKTKFNIEGPIASIVS